MKPFLMKCSFIILLAGCSQDTSRRSLSGNATVNGKPIPFGSILFNPVNDGDGKGSRVQGMADIVNGRYQTVDNRGPNDGDYIAVVSAADGKPYTDPATGEHSPSGKMMFVEQSVRITVAGNGEVDIDVIPSNRKP